MAAILAPRVEQLEKDHALLRRDHDCLANEVHDKDTGLPAVNKRLNENDVLSAQVRIAISIGKWILTALGTSIVLLLFAILTHAIEIARP